MKPIDRFLAAIRREDAEELLLVTGTPVRVRRGDSSRVLLAQELRVDQIVSLLRDIAPPDQTHGVFADGESSFAYEAQSGAYVVACRRAGNRLEAVVKPRARPEPEAGPRGKALGVVGLQQRLVSIPREPPPPPIDDEGSGRVGVLKNQIDRALVSLVAAGGTDLHLTSGLPPRARRDGDLVPLGGFAEPVGADLVRAWLHEILDDATRPAFEQGRDVEVAYEVKNVGRFRISCFRDRRGPAAAARFVPGRVRTADEIGLPPVVKELCGLRRGLLVVTGQTGSGRSTTLAALVDVVNESRAAHVVTLEDPIEVVHESRRALVHQREVGAHVGGYADALRSLRHADADVIVVDELGDAETLTLALELAEAGRLVMGALHLPTAVGAVERILDVMPLERQQQARVMLAESLRGVVAQTLCQRVGGGRVAAWEVLLGLPPIQNLVREGRLFQIPALLQQGRSVGMQTQTDALLQLVESGLVTAEEAYSRAVDKAGIKPALEKLVQRAAGPDGSST